MNTVRKLSQFTGLCLLGLSVHSAFASNATVHINSRSYENEVITPLNRFHGYLVTGASVVKKTSEKMIVTLNAVAGFNQCEFENSVSEVRPVYLPKLEKVVLSVSRKRINEDISCSSIYDPVYQNWTAEVDLKPGHHIEVQTNSLAFGTVRMFGGNNARIAGMVPVKSAQVFDTQKTSWRAMEMESLFELQTTCDSESNFKGFSYTVDNEMWASVQRRAVAHSGCENLPEPVTIPMKHIATYMQSSPTSIKVLNSTGFAENLPWPEWAE